MTRAEELEMWLERKARLIAQEKAIWTDRLLAEDPLARTLCMMTNQADLDECEAHIARLQPIDKLLADIDADLKSVGALPGKHAIQNNWRRRNKRHA